jgi:phosphate transport system substrate-binding protein
MEGNQAIVDAVKSDKNGIGYVGVGYVRDENNEPRQDIKTIPVAKETGGRAISSLDKEAVLNGNYPIFRPIFQYLTRVPEKNSSLDKFLHFEMSEAGQKIIEKTGFYSLTGQDILQNKSLFEKIQ